jgi:hypothetical protein
MSIHISPSGIPKSYQHELRSGGIPNHTAFNIQGHGVAVGTAYQPLWSAADTYDGVSLYDTPNATVEIASTSANDTSAGTGAQTVLLTGIDTSDAVQTDTYTMAGQTVATGSAKTWKAITGVTVLTVGTGDKNLGTIWVGNTGTFSSGVPSTKYGSIAADDTLGKFGVGYVPANHKHWLDKIIFMVGDTNKYVDVRLYIYDGSIQRVLAPFELAQGDFTTDVKAVPALVAGTLYWIEAKVSQNTADVVILTAFTDETI